MGSPDWSLLGLEEEDSWDCKEGFVPVSPINVDDGDYGSCRSLLEILLTKLTISYPLFFLLAYSFYDTVGSKRADENALTPSCPDDLAMSALSERKYTHSELYRIRRIEMESLSFLGMWSSHFFGTQVSIAKPES